MKSLLRIACVLGIAEIILASLISVSGFLLSMIGVVSTNVPRSVQVVLVVLTASGFIFSVVGLSGVLAMEFDLMNWVKGK
jgi:ABC-type microcin C transport system permease subunit YejB